MRKCGTMPTCQLLLSVDTSQVDQPSIPKAIPLPTHLLGADAKKGWIKELDIVNKGTKSLDSQTGVWPLSVQVPT